MNGKAKIVQHKPSPKKSGRLSVEDAILGSTYFKGLSIGRVHVTDDQLERALSRRLGISVSVIPEPLLGSMTQAEVDRLCRELKPQP
ncbi:MAG: hypothetical protein V1827_00910 [Candidatus Micrarchaeota archaeon]